MKMRNALKMVRTLSMSTASVEMIQRWASSCRTYIAQSLKNLHYQEFAERMEFLKYSKEGEEKMTDVIEEYAARKAEAAAKAVERKND